jgi:hypothetical protein
MGWQVAEGSKAADERQEDQGKGKNDHDAHTSASASSDVENGLIWYRNVFSHLHGQPG